MNGFSGLLAQRVVALCGRHPAHGLGLDLGQDSELGRWLVAVALTGPRLDETRWQRAVRSLMDAGLCDPESIANADPARLEAALANPPLELDGADVVSRKLVRLSCELVARYGGSVDALAGECDGLEELGSRLAALSPGFGPASVIRYLRPLRDRWHAASEIPLHRDARAAAVCLGWLADSDDLEGEPGALRAMLLGEPGAPPLADVESALERLGAKACRRQRTRSCPLGDACPARAH